MHINLNECKTCQKLKACPFSKHVRAELEKLKQKPTVGEIAKAVRKHVLETDEKFA